MTTLEKIKELTNEIKKPLFFDGSKFEGILNLKSIPDQSNHFAFLKEQFAKFGSFGKTMPQLTQSSEIKDGTYTFENDDAAEQFKKQWKRERKRRLIQKKVLKTYEVNIENFIV